MTLYTSVQHQHVGLHFQDDCLVCQVVSIFYTVLSPKFLFQQPTPLIEKVFDFHWGYRE